MSTGDGVLDAWLHAASWLFLIGVLMVVGSGVPALVRRFPRILMQGFMLTLASIGVALIAALVRA